MFSKKYGKRMWKNSIEFFHIPLFAFIVHKLLESYAEKAYFPYPIEILFLNLCGSSISHLFVAWLISLKMFSILSWRTSLMKYPKVRYDGVYQEFWIVTNTESNIRRMEGENTGCERKIFKLRE